MDKDITLPCGDGFVNLRVGAVIMRDGRLLMVGNDRADYLYSVGGRIKFGETAEEAVVREVFEETGTLMETDHLCAVHENYFYGDSPTNMDKLIYEISFFFVMKVPAAFEPVCGSFTEDDSKEYLTWVLPDTEKTIYPDFFRTAGDGFGGGVRHYITDERNGKDRSSSK